LNGISPHFTIETPTFFIVGVGADFMACGGERAAVRQLTVHGLQPWRCSAAACRQYKHGSVVMTAYGEAEEAKQAARQKQVQGEL